MKIGVSSYSFSKYMHQTGADYFAVCDLAKKMGYDAIEFIDLSLDVQPAASLTELAQAIRRHCEEINLPIAAYTVGADFLRPNEVQAVMEKVDIAEALGAKVLRHDAAWSLPEGMDWRQLVEKSPRTSAGSRNTPRKRASAPARRITATFCRTRSGWRR